MAGDDLMAGKRPAAVSGAPYPLTREELQELTGLGFEAKGGLNGIVSGLLSWGRVHALLWVRGRERESDTTLTS